MRTVQQPHCPEGAQPSFGDNTSSSSRRAARRCGWSPRRLTDRPLRVNETVTAPRYPGGVADRTPLALSRLDDLQVFEPRLARREGGLQVFDRSNEELGHRRVADPF